MLYPPEAVERAMTIQQVMLRAMSGEITWIQAAEILGFRTRTIRRWRARFEHRGYDGLLDRRRGRPSPRRADFAEVQRVLRLYREHYTGFNGRHFYQIAQQQHGVTLSYTYVKLALQQAGLLPKGRARGRHRRRREPRPCFGELLHLDGSRHQWLALVPDTFYTLIAVVDDATKRLLYAQLVDGGESTAAVMTALRTVLAEHGLPMALYTDRAHWAVHTPTSGSAPDRSRLTQLGRALHHLGIEHILGYSPQARGRSERANRTLQGRLVNELRVAGIRTVAPANRYLHERFIASFNAEFARLPTEPISAFVPLGPVDLEQIFCHQEERVVGRDNVVTFGTLALQLGKQRGRRSCAGLRVVVRRHLDGHHSVWCGPRCFGRFTAAGRPAAA